MYEILNVKGVTFIFRPFKSVETASLGVFLRTGSRFEEKKVKGIAHFLEHMLFKGSQSYSCQKIKREVEGRGGILNAFTSQEITAYYAQFLKKNLIITLDILLDMVFNPVLKIEDINKERNVILEEIKMYNDLPSARAVALLEQQLWQGHCLGEEVIGYVPTVNKINRSDLKNFMAKYYVPLNMVISFSGNFSKDVIIKRLERRIKQNNRKVVLKTTAPKPQKSLKIICEKKPLEQAHLCLGFRGVSYSNSKRLDIELLNVILGANMSSRLFEELREKKSLCYDISTEARKYKDSGGFLIHMGLDKSKTTTALSSILRELDKMKQKEVSSKEFSRAKDYFLGQIAMGLEHPQGMMFYLAQSYLTLGKIDSFDGIKDKVSAISTAKIKELAQDIFKFESACVSCVGNIDDNLDEEIRIKLKKGGRHS